LQLEPLLLALGITLLPIYSFKSGTVQYAHIVLALFILIRFSHQQTKFTRPEIFLIFLTILSLIVEGFATATGASISSLLEPAYLAFNTLVVISLSRVPLQDRAFRWAVIGGLAASTFIAAVSVWYFGASFTLVQSGFERSTGLFNNPNQQGYFAICVASMAGLLYLRDALSRNLCLLLWALASALVMLSVSRASSGALLVLLAFGFASTLDKRRLSPMVMIGALTLVAAVWMAYSAGLLDKLQFVERLKDTGGNRYDNLLARGYTIPFHDPLSFLFGVGTERARIGTMFYRIEVHSTWWSFMGKYGLIGFLLYMGTWVIWTRLILKERGLLGFMIVIVPSIVTGLTGNYSRFTPLYLLIGLSLNRSLIPSRPRPEGVPRRPIDLLAGAPPRPAGAVMGPGRSPPRPAP
jgi:hypothetical protein